ncbi:MAG: hypothetical protein K2I29_04690 [Clostridia bacterium]|nr:hypothetical protein [Clostridia bacterium]
MKKFLTAVICTIVACVFAASLGGCSESEIDGRYYLDNGVAQNVGPMYYLLDKDEQGLYKNINGGGIIPDNFWVEINDDTMTVHGSVTPVVSGETISFNVNQESVREITFTLQTNESNDNWYDIYEHGEFTYYSVLKDGDSLVFQFGKSNPGDYWYSITYSKR